jgi:transcriptional regulator with GAF, ATPase, and Fis domain
VAVNCAAIPANLAESYLFGHRRGAFTGASEDATGYYRAADRGTLLLDEVGELPLDVQAKFLRVLESSEFSPVGTTATQRADVRVIAATNVDLREAVDAGSFRLDLYARLAGFPIRLPALRQRRADIPALLEAFVAHDSQRWSGTFDPPLMEALLLHDWPMNVRELRMAVHRLLLEHAGEPVLSPCHLPRGLLRTAREVAEARANAAEQVLTQVRPNRETLELLLSHAAGNVARVARQLGKDRTQVYRWLKRLGISPESFRDQ